MPGAGGRRAAGGSFRRRSSAGNAGKGTAASAHAGAASVLSKKRAGKPFMRRFQTPGARGGAASSSSSSSSSSSTANDVVHRADTNSNRGRKKTAKRSVKHWASESAFARRRRKREDSAPGAEAAEQASNKSHRTKYPQTPSATASYDSVANIFESSTSKPALRAPFHASTSSRSFGSSNVNPACPSQKSDISRGGSSGSLASSPESSASKSKKDESSFEIGGFSSSSDGDPEDIDDKMPVPALKDSYRTDFISSCEPLASMPSDDDDDCDLANPYRPSTQALYSPERTKRLKKREARTSFAGRTSHGGAPLPGSPSSTPRFSSQVSASSGAAAVNARPEGSLPPPLHKPSRASSSSSSSFLPRNASARSSSSSSTSHTKQNVTNACESVLKNKSMRRGTGLKSGRHSFRRHSTLGSRTAVSGDNTGTKSWLESMDKSLMLDSVTHNLSDSLSGSAPRFNRTNQSGHTSNQPWNDVPSPLGQGSSKKTWMDRNRNRIANGKCGDLARRLLQARAEVARKVNRFRSHNGKDSGIASSSSSFISRSFADPRAGSVFRLKVQDIATCGAEHMIATCSCLASDCAAGKGASHQEGEGTRACFHPGAEVELVLPRNGNQLRKESSSIKAGTVIRVYEPWMSVPKERRIWYGAPGMGRVRNLVVATQLVEADHGQLQQAVVSSS
eukprot:g1979.t1